MMYFKRFKMSLKMQRSSLVAEGIVTTDLGCCCGAELTPGLNFHLPQAQYKEKKKKKMHRRNVSCPSCCNLPLSLLTQLSKTSSDLSKMATIYLVDVDQTPVYTHYFDISYIPSTVFFFNGQHMKVDYG